MECPDCGGLVKREVEQGGRSNRTANRYVGGRNMNVVRRCTDCGREIHTTSGETGESH